MAERNPGYLYVAVGENYLNEAVRSLRSLKRFHPGHPICLITDQVYKNSLFDQVIQMDLPNPADHKKYGYMTKIVGMLHSPFTHTLFIDTDTCFLGDCQELFGVLDFFDLMICHDYQEHNFAQVKGQDLIGYNTYNTGVIAIKKNESTQRFLARWKEVFQEKIEEYWSDQPAFMDALLYHDIKTYSLQTIYNFRFNQFLPISHGKVKILHGRHTKMDEIGNILNSSDTHRVWDPRAWKCRSWQNKKTLREKISELKTKVTSAIT